MFALSPHSSQESKPSNSSLQNPFLVMLSLEPVFSNIIQAIQSPALIYPAPLKTKKAPVCIPHSRASLPHPSFRQGDAQGWTLTPLWRILLELTAPNLQESSWTRRCQNLKITLKRKVKKENITVPSSENGTVLWQWHRPGLAQVFKVC